MVREPDAATKRAPQNNQLMSERGILSLKPDLRLEQRGQHGQDKPDEPDHRGNLADSSLKQARIGFSVHTGQIFNSADVVVTSMQIAGRAEALVQERMAARASALSIDADLGPVFGDSSWSGRRPCRSFSSGTFQMRSKLCSASQSYPRAR